MTKKKPERIHGVEVLTDKVPTLGPIDAFIAVDDLDGVNVPSLIRAGHVRLTWRKADRDDPKGDD